MITFVKLFENFFLKTKKHLPHLPTQILAGQMSKIKKSNKKFKKLFKFTN